MRLVQIGPLGGGKSSAAREAERLFENNLPGSSLWYARLVMRRLLLERLQEAADPHIARSRARRRRELHRDYGQDYFWAPGETAPARGPAWSGAGGH